MTSAPSSSSKNDRITARLAACTIVVVRLAVLVDVVTITAGIAIILPSVDAGAENAAEHCTRESAGSRLHTRQDRTCNRAGSGADRRTCNRIAGLRIAVIAVVVIAVVIAVVVIRVIAVLVRVGGAAGHRNAGDKGRPKTKLFHRLVLLNSPLCCRANKRSNRRFVPALTMYGSCTKRPSRRPVVIPRHRAT